jgi:hypothetical protein
MKPGEIRSLQCAAGGIHLMIGKLSLHLTRDEIELLVAELLRAQQFADFVDAPGFTAARTM